MSEPPGLSAETLLRHEPFVRAVVRGLLSDEDRVQDVLQETWLRALRHPPRAGASLRAWLARVAQNLARDAQRSRSRRTVRERTAARPETVESIDVAYARLAAQREIVDAVLTLEEPYRSVVLLCYYQDLGAAEIGERLGRSPATVRSQLSRAHAILRAALDGRFGDRRSAWASMLLWPQRRGPVLKTIGELWASAGAKAALLALVAGAMAVLPQWLGTSRPTAGPWVGSGEPAAPAQSAPSQATLALASTEPTPGTRLPAQGGPRRAFDPGQRARLGSRSVPQLLELAVQIQRAIEKHLLTPDEAVLSQHSAFLSMPQTGICRIVDGKGEFALDHAITRRGGGAYFSFATKEHSYDAEPDLKLDQGRFETEFYGIQVGLLLELGDVALTDLPTRGYPVPHWLPEEKREAWEVLWDDISPEDAADGSGFRERTKALRRSLAPAGTSSTFLLRAFSPREHDHLVAFRPLVLDKGCTLAWRILKTWPVPGEPRGRSARRGEHREVPEGPSWINELSLEDLIGLLARVRAEAREELLGVPQELQARYASIVGQEAAGFAVQTGFARILQRERRAPLIEARGGGAYWSFLTRSNSFDDEPELELQEDRYSSGFSGRETGWLLDLGVIPFRRLAAVMSGAAPDGLSAREREAMNFLRTVRASVGESKDGRRTLRETDAARAAELGLGRSVPAIVGHTYLLRSVLFGSHDHLVAFTAIGGDEYGHTLAWRILESWPVEQPSPGR